MTIGSLHLTVPFFLAPMAGITDQPFRILARNMGCGLVVSEMISAKGVCFNNAKTLSMMEISQEEHPIAIQLFGNNPEDLAFAARYAEKIGADAVDFNMGCPVQKIVANSEGSALMKTPKLAYEILSAMVDAVSIPVTVKMRTGWDEYSINAVECAKLAEKSGVAMITVHGRTKKQLYEGKADWNIIAEVKRNVKIPVIGNGDLFSVQDVKDMFEQTDVDGVMIGRGADGNPWIFRQLSQWFKGEVVDDDPAVSEKFGLALEHLHMLVRLKGETLAVREFKRHIGAYIRGLPGAAAARVKFYKIATLEAFVDEMESYRRFLGA